ncbi:aldehyde dehydrogenase [Rhodococcus sp. 15-649-2-2]|nr:aldehyde dehydrogenase [Rhodococcus sp. 15-649-2-2]
MEYRKMTPTTATHVDRALADLAVGEKVWADTTILERIALLTRTRVATAEVAREWADMASEIKLLDPQSPLAGEEWAGGPYAFLAGLNALVATLTKIERGQSPLDGAVFGRAPGNRVTVRALPVSVTDRLMFGGFRADIWLQPEVSEKAARASAGLGALDPTRTAGITVVLGAGNVTSIAPLDVLYQLIADNRVVALKVNPILDELTPIIERALAPLIEWGVLRMVAGGVDVGEYLAHHDSVSHVHITGSLSTHDVVVFGSGDDGRLRQEAGTPLLAKTISSELGGVSPVIVVPGTWSAADIQYQAENVVTSRLHNAGHNCIGTQVMIVSSDWPQKDDFIAAVRDVLDHAPHRPAWYPGAVARLEQLKEDTGHTEHRGPTGDRLLLDLDAGESTSFATTEVFATALAFTTIPGVGAEFLTAAVTYANDELTGTLGATIIVDPETQRTLEPPLDHLLEPLQYGNVGVNVWTLLGFALPRATWGAFPGHTLSDAQSGIGVVHNAYLIDRTERTVVRGPFLPFPRSILGGEMSLSPKPSWFVTSRSGRSTSEALTRFEAKRTWRRLLRVAVAAMRA